MNIYIRNVLITKKLRSRHCVGQHWVEAVQSVSYGLMALAIVCIGPTMVLDSLGQSKNQCKPDGQRQRDERQKVA